MEDSIGKQCEICGDWLNLMDPECLQRAEKHEKAMNRPPPNPYWPCDACRDFEIHHPDAFQFIERAIERINGKLKQLDVVGK